jgi:hypothetical protein
LCSDLSPFCTGFDGPVTGAPAVCQTALGLSYRPAFSAPHFDTPHTSRFILLIARISLMVIPHLLCDLIASILTSNGSNGIGAVSSQSEPVSRLGAGNQFSSSLSWAHEYLCNYGSHTTTLVSTPEHQGHILPNNSGANLKCSLKTPKRRLITFHARE